MAKVHLTHLRPTRPLAALDCETTGTDPATARVVEVAALRLAPGADPAWFRTRVNPGVPIPAAAAAVHGIHDRNVKGKPKFAEVAQSLDRFLAGADLVAYNAGFDLAVLAAEFARAGVRFRVAGRAVVDPLAVFRREEPRTLAHAVRFYLGAEHAGGHTAAGDAAAALRVLDAQVGRYGLPATAEALHAELVPVDVAGKFARNGAGDVTLGFGKHRGRPLAAVAAEDGSYLRWVLANVPLLDDARKLVHAALAGTGPCRADQ